MSVEEESAQQTLSVCWCCGGEFDDRDLVRLGMHPEVGVCLGCARFLQQRAVEREDELHPSRSAQVRAGVRAVRDWVIARGWHRLPIIGQILRRIDRHLP